ncbi:hypothetical protein L7F22_025372 [Adiantum nelumboides]|nr:hypothetical protein [Adiantum nelumboides]
MGLSFEDGGPAAEHNDTEQSADLFGLKDIEPNTIPAIRSMISDVMFDIPFYMSHHKGRMIKALVSEANRVYRLWCRNNQGFSEHLRRAEPETHIFEFDTTNLFLVGSRQVSSYCWNEDVTAPTRTGKAGANAADIADRSVATDSGRFGCLAVDNIYNVLAKEDPIAYLLNGAIDPNYAAALQIAYVPTTSASLLKSLGDVVRQVVPGMSPAADPFAVDAIRPLTVACLPSWSWKFMISHGKKLQKDEHFCSTTMVRWIGISDLEVGPWKFNISTCSARIQATGSIKISSAWSA